LTGANRSNYTGADRSKGIKNEIIKTTISDIPEQTGANFEDKKKAL